METSVIKKDTIIFILFISVIFSSTVIYLFHGRISINEEAIRNLNQKVFLTKGEHDGG